MKHAEIIVALGDTAIVADALKRKESAVSNWKRRGIPWNARPRLARMAKEKGVLLPADFLVQI